MSLTLLMVALVPWGTGCGGIVASRSISPATFLLPGLMMNEPDQSPGDQLVPIVEPEVITLANAQ